MRKKPICKVTWFLSLVKEPSFYRIFSLAIYATALYFLQHSFINHVALQFYNAKLRNIQYCTSFK